MTNRHSKFGIALVSLAFFFFLLMECTLYYQAVLEPYPSHESFLLTQLPVLGASALGYLTFPVYARKVKRMGRRVLAVAFTVIGLACLAAEYACPSEHGVFWMGCLSFYLLGIAGGGSLWACSVVLSSSTHVALWVAACHAAGMAAQTALSQLPLGDFAETLLVGFAIVAFVAFTMATWPSMKSPRRLPLDDSDYSFYERKPFPYRETAHCNPDAAPVKLALTICVVIGIFSLLFNLLYCAVPDGSLSVAERTDISSRIALIAGGLIMGLFINVGNGKHIGASILCVALLAAVATFASKTGMDQSACQTLFFMGWGAFSVFYTMSTVWIAPFMKIPQLWAGMGRIVTSVVAIVAWAPSLSIASRSDTTALTIAILLLLAAVVVAMNSAQAAMPRKSNGAFVVDDLRQTERGRMHKSERAKADEAGGGCTTGVAAAQRRATGRNDASALPETPDSSLGSDLNNASSGSASQNERERIAVADRETPSSNATGEQTASAASHDAPGDRTNDAPGANPFSNEAIERFAATYGLTPRETNVLAAVMQDERPLKQVAADLDVTIRTVQRHLTSIYQKTGTQTRAGLAVRFFYEGKAFAANARDAPPARNAS